MWTFLFNIVFPTCILAFRIISSNVNYHFQLIDNNVSHSKDSGYSNRSDETSPECMALILEFIHSLMVHQVESLAVFYPKLTTISLNWVNSDWVSYQALSVLSKIVETSADADDVTKTETLQQVINSLPAFVLILQSHAVPSNMENCRRLGALLQLFRNLLRIDEVRSNVLQAVKEDSIAKIFTPLQLDSLGVEWLPILKSEDTSVTATDAVDTYLYALGLVNDLTQYGANWLSLQSTLMENR